MGHQRVMLIRARPGAVGSDRALDLAASWARAPASGLVFFHGPGLGHVALANSAAFSDLADAGLELRVCRAGWQRLEKGPLPEPFAEGSLLHFWDAALGASEVCSFGAGGYG